jgi:hypothetical protein
MIRRKKRFYFLYNVILLIFKGALMNGGVRQILMYQVQKELILQK